MANVLDTPRYERVKVLIQYILEHGGKYDFVGVSPVSRDEHRRLKARFNCVKEIPYSMATDDYGLLPDSPIAVHVVKEMNRDTLGHRSGEAVFIPADPLTSSKIECYAVHNRYKDRNGPQQFESIVVVCHHDDAILVWMEFVRALHGRGWVFDVYPYFSTTTMLMVNVDSTYARHYDLSWQAWLVWRAKEVPVSALAKNG